MKADLHVHSNASHDSPLDPVDILRIAKGRGLGAVAILDHNAVEGSRRASELAGEVGMVLVRGTEVSTIEGHVGAYGVTEAIPKGMTAIETVEKIHALGGFAVAVHPYRMTTGIGSRAARACGFDAVEIVNGFTTTRHNLKARRLADSLSLPYTAGSDAHDARKIGAAFIEVDDCQRAEELLELIRKKKGTAVGEGASPRDAVIGAYELTRDWAKRGFKRL